ncbi:ribosome-binding factor A [bacterium BMS3Bbin12]|nr:ribosome-binding factor A [bacterium BMS3Abin12]GBE47740.1 ribosome-binding factor A [bacterium BMS3Bbin12]GBE51010.1 ribosome-binding factor A [bacterium BMS3Bbin13]HDK02259.1 30S ribosome-binding factor RbfA [Gammaproteobacteria bacterium]
MPKEFSRTRRVGEQIQRELSALIRRDLQDPRAGWVTITGVRMSRDLVHARVFVSVLDENRDPMQAVAALNHAAGFLRRLLGRTLGLRVVPRLRFEHDASIERGARLSSLIDQAVNEDRNKRAPAAEAHDGTPGRLAGLEDPDNGGEDRS